MAEWVQIGLLRIQVIPEHLTKPHKYETYDGWRWEQAVYELPEDWRELAYRNGGIPVEIRPLMISADTKRKLKRMARKYSGKFWVA